jgi:hypothetical protein
MGAATLIAQLRFSYVTRLESPMRLTLVLLAGAALALSACGHGVEQRAASGALAGAVVAGPVGAAVGGAAGAVVSKAAD